MAQCCAVRRDCVAWIDMPQCCVITLLCFNAWVSTFVISICFCDAPLLRVSVRFLFSVVPPPLRCVAVQLLSLW